MRDKSDSQRRKLFHIGGVFRFIFFSACIGGIHTPGLLAQNQSYGVIVGRVTDGNGESVRTLVHLVAQGDVPVEDSYTDSHGTFSFSPLPGGTYYVIVEAEGFRPFREYVLLDLGIDPKRQVDANLERIPKESQVGSPIVEGSKGSHELDAKKPARPFNSKARREYDKGNDRLSHGDFRSAVDHYQKALRLEPDFYAALNNLGTIYLRQKDLAQAKAAFLKSIQANPEDGEAYINLGHVSYEQGNYPHAIERLEEGLKRSPESSVGHFFLGSAYLKAGDLARAEENLKAACKLEPAGMASAHLQLANLYLRRGDATAASAQLQNYLQANPSDPQAPAIKKMVDSITAKRTN